MAVDHFCCLLVALTGGDFYLIMSVNFPVMQNTCNFKKMENSNMFALHAVENVFRCIFLHNWVEVMCPCLYHSLFVGVSFLLQCLFSLQVRNLEEAVQELWKRKDEADKDLIASLRADAGLPTQEEIFYISPFSDDEDSESLLLKNENSRSLKFSLKGIGEKSHRKTKESGKKSSKKRFHKKNRSVTPFTSGTPTENLGGHTDGPLFGYNSGDNKDKEIQVSGKHGPGFSKYKYIDEVTVAAGTKKPGIIKMKNQKPHSFSDREDSGAQSGKPKAGQGPKLVIHLGARNRNTDSPSKCDASSLKKGQNVTSSNGMTSLICGCFCFYLK